MLQFLPVTKDKDLNYYIIWHGLYLLNIFRILTFLQTFPQRIRMEVSEMRKVRSHGREGILSLHSNFSFLLNVFFVTFIGRIQILEVLVLE